MDDVITPARPRRSTAGRKFPADPPRVDEIIAVMRAAGDGPYGVRLGALIVRLWRSGVCGSARLAASR